MLESPFITDETKAEIRELLEKIKNLISSKTIRNLTDEFVKIARTKKIPLYYDNQSGVDTNIFAWLPNAIVTETPPPAGQWKKVDTKKGTTEQEMHKTVVNVKMPLAQAIVKFTEMLKNGEFNKKGTYRIIFLTETRNGNPLLLMCHYCSSGVLRLLVDVGYPVSVWDDPDHVWFSSNEPLKS
jgi:hypothetical protein